MTSMLSVFAIGLVLGILIGLFVYNTMMLMLFRGKEQESKVIRRLLRMDEGEK